MMSSDSLLLLASVATSAIIIAAFWWRDRQALNAIKEDQRHRLLRDMRQLEHEDADSLRKAMGELAADVTHGRVVIEGSLEQIKRVADSLDKLPALVEGLEALVKSQTDKLDSLNRAVEVLEKSVVPSGTEGYSEFADEDVPDDVRDELEVKRLVRAGIPVDSARARIREQALYRGATRGR